LDDIEIKDEYYTDGNDDATRNRVQN